MPELDLSMMHFPLHWCAGRAKLLEWYACRPVMGCVVKQGSAQGQSGGKGGRSGFLLFGQQASRVARMQTHISAAV